MEDLKVALIQADLAWNNPQANRENLSLFLAPLLQEDVDLVVLPEMFSTGFTMLPQAYAEAENGDSFMWMHEWAQKLQATLVGSISTQTSTGFVNRCYVVNEGGLVTFYDKKHLFSYANEQNHYQAGDKQVLFDLKGWKIMPLICYDLRFPVWARNTMDYDLLLYVANWPERRAYPWKTLLSARAIENMSYVIGVNRVGADGNEITHSGDSRVIDPLGEPVWEAEPSKEAVGIVTLDKAYLIQTRNRFGFLNDKDAFELK